MFDAMHLEFGRRRLPLLLLKTPCLLHWDTNHFVVLRSASAKGVVLHDPAVGMRRLTYDDVDEHFSGFALELTPAPGFQPVDERRRVSLRSVIGSSLASENRYGRFNGGGRSQNCRAGCT